MRQENGRLEHILGDSWRRLLGSFYIHIGGVPFDFKRLVNAFGCVDSVKLLDALSSFVIVDMRTYVVGYAREPN